MLYDEYLQVLKNKKDIASFQCSLKRLENKLIENQDNFNRATSHLFPNMRFFLYDSNICVEPFFLDKCCLFSSYDFNESVFLYDKQKEYFFIKDYLLTARKLLGKLAVCDLNFYGEILRYFLQPSIKNRDYKPPEAMGLKSPEEAVKFLYNLTCGDMKTLYDFGRICGQILFRKNTRPAVVLAPSFAHEELRKFFAGLNHPIFYFNVEEMITKENIERLFYLNLNSIQQRSLIICIGGKIPTSKSVRDKLHFVLKGQTLVTAHPYFKDKFYITNQLPVIYITDSHEQYITMKSEFNAIGVKLPCRNAENLKYEYSPWYETIFGYMGYRWLESKRSNGRGPYKATSDDVIKGFIKELCIIDEAAMCEKGEFYSVYEIYCEKRFGVQPLTRKAFSIRFAQYGDFDTVRIHKETKIAPYYFKGVKIDAAKYKMFLESADFEKYHLTFEKFNEKLIKCIQNEKERLQKTEDENNNDQN